MQTARCTSVRLILHYNTDATSSRSVHISVPKRWAAVAKYRVFCACVLRFDFILAFSDPYITPFICYPAAARGKVIMVGMYICICTPPPPPPPPTHTHTKKKNLKNSHSIYKLIQRLYGHDINIIQQACKILLQFMDSISTCSILQ